MPNRPTTKENEMPNRPTTKRTDRRRWQLPRLLAALMAVALMAAACGSDDAAPESSDDAETPSGGDETLDIVVSMKGPGGGNPFWASVEEGANAAGDEFGVNVTVVAPPSETDVAAQISLIEDQIVQGVDAIVLAPTDPAALEPVVDQAIEAGIPVVFVDTNGTNEGVSFIGTDNTEGARLAGAYLCDNLEAGSDVAILQGVLAQSTAQLRYEGSKAGFEACGLNIVAEQPANWDRAEGQTVTENILTGNPNLAGIFASNDNMALGAIEALRGAGLLDQVTVVGFDANPDAADSILAGEMSATIAQNPFNMGFLGVENAIALVNGDTIDAIIDTGTILVDESNAADFGSGDAPAVDASPAEDLRIVVSMKGPGGGNPFWASVEEGANAAGDEFGVNVTVVAPPSETDVAAQISLIEDQIVQGVDAIVLAPTDPAALEPVVDQAIEAGIPVVFVDTNGTNEGVSFIGTDNTEGARLAGAYLCDNLEAGSDVAILQGVLAQSTAQLRYEGSKAGFEACGLNIVAEQPANWDRAEGQTVTENILTGNPNLAGIFASNDNMALGAIEALRGAGLLDQVTVVGFDANPDAADSILAGEMSATIAQNPFNMGFLGVENAIALVNGDTIDAIIDTGTILVDESNAADFQ